MACLRANSEIEDAILTEIEEYAKRENITGKTATIIVFTVPKWLVARLE